MRPPAFIRVATYNIHAGLDPAGRPSLPGIRTTLGQIRPDLVGLQEVERGFRARAGYADQAGLLADELGLDLRFGPAIDLAPGEAAGKFGNAVLSTMPIAGCRLERLPGRGEPRVLLDAAVDTPWGRAHFLTCHLGLDREERRRQIDCILKRIEALRAPAILAGDFNARPGDPEMAPLFAALAEAQTVGGQDRTTHPRSGARIDYIFATPDWQFLRAQVVPSPASDHLPLVADLRIDR